ncbi:thiamine pyrophosphate-binding protein [Moorena producens JHB]|uniref:Alpha-keto-acid decarboxylase n=1 Tax=Moorena producens (strain JHB) TaxID=1454205 RepID=A0A1D9FX58_MOOP1|nr:thiamine pyrophosphate-binding protein [Moorena producens]AOY79750.1 thiamine pyrophosphate-binding protein [Moorena producens JHB]
MAQSDVVTVGQYLTQRLQAAGVKHIFGVVGDYVLGLMDVLLESSVELIYTCNELNAGYAADAYARLNGVGGLCVTYNVGGLSLVNAVAGAYAELVPLIVISGAPNSSQRQQKLLLHHTAGNYNLQLEIFEKITVAAVRLTSPSQAARQIDQTIGACLRHRRPVYIEIPSDLVNQPCPVTGERDLPEAPIMDVHALSEAVEEAVSLLEQSQHPVIIAGVELHRYGIADQLTHLLEQTGYPFATTLLGKSIISEGHPQFIGSYAGAFSQDYVRQRVETADCILCLGAFMSDINLGAFTAQLPEDRLINANSDKVKIKHHFYSPVYLPDFMAGLTATLQKKKSDVLDIKPAIESLSKRFESQPQQKLTNARFYERITHFIDDDSIVIAETGDALIATVDLVLHGDSDYIGQALYTSIGFSVPACLGVALAAPNRRPIVFVGDGAFQMTCQELSTIIRHQLNPIIFLINNDGYTIERAIHEGSYNNIQPWKYHQLPQVFGNSWSCQVRTEGELELALEQAKANEDKISFIEVHLDRLDCSYGVKRLGKALSAMQGLSE